MAYIPCKACGGRGLVQDNSGPCDACDGYGIMVIDEGFRLVQGGGGMETTVENKVEPAKKPFQYYPERHLLVRDETLIVWREDLEKKERDLLKEIDKLHGGMAQIDAELARRRKKAGS